MKCTQAELVAAKTAIRRRHGCDSYYVGSHESVNLAEASVVHEFILDDAASTAYVWFVSTEPRIVLKDAATPSPRSAPVLQRTN
jgi:hypothetical protein